MSLSPMIKDRQRAGVRFICGGDVVGEGKPGSPGSDGAVTLPRSPFSTGIQSKIETNEHEHDLGKAIERQTNQN